MNIFNVFNKVRIRTRLAMIMGFMAVMLFVSGAIGLSGIIMTNKSLEETYKNKLEPTKMIGRIMMLMNNNRVQIMQALQHAPESPFVKAHVHPVTFHTDAIIKNRDEISTIVESYKKRHLTSEEQVLSDKYEASRSQYVNAGLVAANEALLAGDYNRANEIYLNKVDPLYRIATGDAEALLQKTLDAAKAEYDLSVERYVLIRNISIGGTLMGVLLAAFAGVLLIRSIVHPLGKAVGHFQEMAQGNLTETIELSSFDEVGQVMIALATMQDHLKNIMGKIISASTSIDVQSHRLNAEMFSVVEHSDSQHDRVQSVASAMVQVSQSVTEVASNAQNTANAAAESQDIVADSIKQMAQSIDATTRVVDAVQASNSTITALSTAIQRIGEITNTIKEIADQTNLLALNAAIEAARAGEQGRGFAVVADEVRKLAERTANSTTDITLTVNEIQSTTEIAVSSMNLAVAEVAEGIALMKNSGKNLDKITNTSGHVTDMAQNIAAAAKQQSVASEDVSKSMEEITALIEENTRAAQHAWKVTEELSNTAEFLRAQVGCFRV